MFFYTIKFVNLITKVNDSYNTKKILTSFMFGCELRVLPVRCKKWRWCLSWTAAALYTCGMASYLEKKLGRVMGKPDAFIKP